MAFIFGLFAHRNLTSDEDNPPTSSSDVVIVEYNTTVSTSGDETYPDVTTRRTSTDYVMSGYNSTAMSTPGDQGYPEVITRQTPTDHTMSIGTNSSTTVKTPAVINRQWKSDITDNLMKIMLPVAGGFLVLVLFLLCLCCYRRRRRVKLRKTRAGQRDSRPDTIPLEDLLMKPSLADPDSVFSEYSFTRRSHSCETARTLSDSKPISSHNDDLKLPPTHLTTAQRLFKQKFYSVKEVKRKSQKKHRFWKRSYENLSDASTTEMLSLEPKDFNPAQLILGRRPLHDNKSLTRNTNQAQEKLVNRAKEVSQPNTCETDMSQTKGSAENTKLYNIDNTQERNHDNGPKENISVAVKTYLDSKKPQQIEIRSCDNLNERHGPPPSPRVLQKLNRESYAMRNPKANQRKQVVSRGSYCHDMAIFEVPRQSIVRRISEEECEMCGYEDEHASARTMSCPEYLEETELPVKETGRDGRSASTEVKPKMDALVSGKAPGLRNVASTRLCDDCRNEKQHHTEAETLIPSRHNNQKIAEQTRKTEGPSPTFKTSDQFNKPKPAGDLQIDHYYPQTKPSHFPPRFSFPDDLRDVPNVTERTGNNPEPVFNEIQGDRNRLQEKHYPLSKSNVIEAQHDSMQETPVSPMTQRGEHDSITTTAEEGETRHDAPLLPISKDKNEITDQDMNRSKPFGKPHGVDKSNRDALAFGRYDTKESNARDKPTRKDHVHFEDSNASHPAPSLQETHTIYTTDSDDSDYVYFNPDEHEETKKKNNFPKAINKTKLRSIVTDDRRKGSLQSSPWSKMSDEKQSQIIANLQGITMAGQSQLSNADSNTKAISAPDMPPQSVKKQNHVTIAENPNVKTNPSEGKSNTIPKCADPDEKPNDSPTVSEDEAESDESDYDNPWHDIDDTIRKASVRYNRRKSRIQEKPIMLKSAEDLGRLMEERSQRLLQLQRELGNSPAGIRKSPLRQTVKPGHRTQITSETLTSIRRQRPKSVYET